LTSKTYRKFYTLNLLGVFIANCILGVLALRVYILYGNIENFILTFSLLFVIVNLKGAVEIAFFIPNVILMKKYNKHRPYLLDIPLIAASCIIVLFISPATPIWLFLIAMALAGAGSSCLGFIPMALLPDLADVGELIYGERREGVSAGLNTLGRKIVAGLTSALLGLLLGAFGLNAEDLSQTAATASPHALLVLKIMYSVLPILACAGMILISRSYKLNRARHDMIKRIIAEKRENGFAALTDAEIKDCESVTGLPFEKLWIAEKPPTPVAPTVSVTHRDKV
jgi:Na+/melibiose symporter-like transporter